jgi:hypothetical protein
MNFTETEREEFVDIIMEKRCMEPKKHDFYQEVMSSEEKTKLFRTHWTDTHAKAKALVQDVVSFVDKNEMDASEYMRLYTETYNVLTRPFLPREFERKGTDIYIRQLTNRLYEKILSVENGDFRDMVETTILTEMKSQLDRVHAEEQWNDEQKKKFYRIFRYLMRHHYKRLVDENQQALLQLYPSILTSQVV